jgi:predicted dehydrogenase
MASVNKLRVGVVGGGFGRNHILAFQATEGVEVAAFCQRTRAAAEKVAGEFKIPRVFTDYGEMLERGGLDAVSLATPTNVHLPLTMAALERGAAVLCEKPLAMNRDDAAAMLEKAEAGGVVHVTAFNFRFIPAFFRMKELLEEGYVGDRILHAEANWLTGSRGDPEAPFGWRHQKEVAGFGAMGDVGVHLVDLVRWMAGDFKKVCGQQAIFTKERTVADGRKMPVTVEDCAIFIAELTGGGLVSFQANGAARGGVYQSVAITGNEGVLKAEVDRNKPGWIVGSLAGAQGSGPLQPLPIPERLTRSVNASDPRRAMGESIFANLTRLMAEGMRSGRQPSPSFRDGLEAQKVLDALVTSSESGSWVTVV